MSEENKALARRGLEEVLGQGKWDVLDELTAADVGLYYKAPVAPGGRVDGRDALRQLLQTYRAAFPDLSVAVEDQVAEGDKVVTRYSTTGTHQGPLPNLPATGKRVSVSGIGVQRFAGGQFVEGWVVDNQLGLLQQLGVVPSV